MSKQIRRELSVTSDLDILAVPTRQTGQGELFQPTSVHEVLVTTGTDDEVAPADGYAEGSSYIVTLDGPILRKDGTPHATRTHRQRVTGGSVGKLPKGIRGALYGPAAMVKFFPEP